MVVQKPAGPYVTSVAGAVAESADQAAHRLAQRRVGYAHLAMLSVHRLDEALGEPGAVRPGVGASFFEPDGGQRHHGGEHGESPVDTIFDLPFAVPMLAPRFAGQRLEQRRAGLDVGR